LETRQRGAVDLTAPFSLAMVALLAILVLGVVVIGFPLYVTFVASTLTYDQIITVPMPLLPGNCALRIPMPRSS